MSDISVGAWIKQQRLDHDWTQDDLARRVSCSVSTIRKLEADQRRPSRQLVAQLAKEFALTADSLQELERRVRTPGAAPAGPAQGAGLAGPRPLGATNLPLPATAFIGRGREIPAVQALLRRANVRLLTLTGPPGIGKTRLALEAAGGLRADFPDGIWYVPLAPLRDARLVTPLVARTLGVKEAPGASVRGGLQEYLADRQLLLLLDNFEQVLEAAPLVAEWLAGAPGVEALVTSRATLGLYGEHQFPVPFLELPDPQEGASPEQLIKYEAVHLFLECARAVKPDFTLTAENAPLVAAVCARLEGLPLTIELAAARLRIFSLNALLTRLQSRLLLLTGGARDLPVRQQTLRGALDWSYDLLDPAEQRLFCRLGVFVQGCMIDAAEAVCADAAGAGGPILAGLESLVAQSLLQQEEHEDGEPRFVLLETIREYAVERLTASGAAAATERRHAFYYLALAERAARALRGKQQQTWLARLDKEADNLRAALAWAIDGREVDLALRLGGALGRFWEVHGPVSEGRRWLEAALALDTGEPTAARATALNAAGNLAFDEDDYAAANARHTESLALRRALADVEGIAAALNSLGNVAQRQGEHTRAQQYYEESLALHRATGHWDGAGLTLINLGAVAAEQGAYAQAIVYLEEALTRMRAVGDQWGAGLALNHLGEVALYQGEYGRAAALLEESLGLLRKLGDKRRSARTLGNLGMLARKQTDYMHGRPFYQESLALFRELGAKHGIAVCLEGLAAVAGAQGDVARAGRLRGAAGAIRAGIGAPRPPDGQVGQERRVSATRVAVDARLVAAAWAEGQAMPVDQAVAYALEGSDLPRLESPPAQPQP